MHTMTRDEIETRRHELKAEVAAATANIIREGNPRTLRALARDLDEDRQFHEGMLAMRRAKTPAELDEACRACGIDPNRRELKLTPSKIDTFATARAACDAGVAALRAMRPQTVATASTWSRAFAKLAGLADAIGICRTQLWYERRDGRIIVRHEPRLGWRVKVDGMPPEVVARLGPCITD